MRAPQAKPRRLQCHIQFRRHVTKSPRTDRRRVYAELPGGPLPATPTFTAHRLGIAIAILAMALSLLPAACAAVASAPARASRKSWSCPSEGFTSTRLSVSLRTSLSEPPFKVEVYCSASHAPISDALAIAAIAVAIAVLAAVFVHVRRWLQLAPAAVERRGLLSKSPAQAWHRVNIVSIHDRSLLRSWTRTVLLLVTVTSAVWLAVRCAHGSVTGYLQGQSDLTQSALDSPAPIHSTGAGAIRHAHQIKKCGSHDRCHLLWTFWAGPQPEIVQLCIATWRKHLPGWTSTVPTPEAVGAYAITKSSTFENLTRTTQSDVIRLSILFDYGGLWLDASTYLTENLHWLEEHAAEHPYYGLVNYASVNRNRYMGTSRAGCSWHRIQVSHTSKVAGDIEQHSRSVASHSARRVHQSMHKQG